jgi:hypothetical protein
MFVFSLFLPVVLFVFQLWWMLALRFCWPRNDDAVRELTGYLASHDLADINDPTDPDNPDRRDLLDALLEVPGGAALLADTGLFKVQNGLSGALTPTLDPATAVVGVTPVPEPRPDDPLCPRPGPGGAP